MKIEFLPQKFLYTVFPTVEYHIILSWFTGTYINVKTRNLEKCSAVFEANCVIYTSFSAVSLENERKALTYI